MKPFSRRHNANCGTLAIILSRYASITVETGEEVLEEVLGGTAFVVVEEGSFTFFPADVKSDDYSSSTITREKGKKPLATAIPDDGMIQVWSWTLSKSFVEDVDESGYFSLLDPTGVAAAAE